MLSRFLVTFCKMYRSAKKNANCLVFLLLSCIRCWIKSWSDRFPLWRRVWSSRPHLAVVFFLSRVVHILRTWSILLAGSGTHEQSGWWRLVGNRGEALKTCIRQGPKVRMRVNMRREPSKGRTHGIQSQLLNQFYHELMRCWCILEALFIRFLAASFTTPDLLM